MCNGLQALAIVTRGSAALLETSTCTATTAHQASLNFQPSAPRIIPSADGGRASRSVRPTAERSLSSGSDSTRDGALTPDVQFRVWTQHSAHMRRVMMGSKRRWYQAPAAQRSQPMRLPPFPHTAPGLSTAHLQCFSALSDLGHGVYLASESSRLAPGQG